PTSMPTATPVGTCLLRRWTRRTNWASDPSARRRSRTRVIGSRMIGSQGKVARSPRSPRSREPMSRPMPQPSVPIRDPEAFPLRIQPPPRRLVLDRATVALKARRALLAASPLPAVEGEARDGRPDACGGRLAGWRVEAGGERILLGQAGAGRLQVVGAHAA